MDAARRSRSALRAVFTRAANKFDEQISMEELDLQETQTAWHMFQLKEDSLLESDKVIYTFLLESGATEQDLTKELLDADEYTSRFLRLKLKYESSITNDANSCVSARTVKSEDGNNTTKRRYKLPNIEFKKFGGDIRDWLLFWGQFKKIHEDEDLDEENKFQYLLQAITPGTRARQLVDSFPPIKENYQKVIDSLYARFGREDLLVEVYVRELLKLVLNNNNTKMVGISTLYDQVETQLNALDTLGVTTDKCASMLYPLVESCLPEELLRVWQRSASFAQGSNATTINNRLCGLMEFLKLEVENEERISLATEGFGLTKGVEKSRGNKKQLESSIPTAAALINYNAKQCVFCEGSHNSHECFKAQKLSLNEKRKLLTNKRVCFLCFRYGHISKRCREKISCLVCSGRHRVLMCPEIAINKKDKNSVEKPTTEKKETEPGKAEEHSLANRSDTHVFMPTLRVLIIGRNHKKEVRALLDSGSQRSYILKSTVEELQLSEKRKEKIVHSLFGGVNTAEQLHGCYDIQISTYDENYTCYIEVLDQTNICNNIPTVHKGSWSTELQDINIEISDTREPRKIELLLGADVSGKLLTGAKRNLRCGLVAIQTVLGWTLLGKVPESSGHKSTTMNVMTLFANDATITNLWQLDTLGIRDPLEEKSKQELQKAALEHFKQTVVVDSSGRYEVNMPWLEGHPPLPDNHNMTQKRLETAKKKLKSNQLYVEYGQVFDDWLKEGIIEEVPCEELIHSAHYLPHRPVIKMNSATTKIRPVFDASAHEKNQPSLNDCLEKGPNLIELIPSLLSGFRKYKIGVVSDIRKAFLQIGLSKKDRDFLRFIWFKQDGSQVIYRHRRVVFGVCCSPFLLGATIQHHLTQTSFYPEQISEIMDKLRKSFYVDNCITSVSDETELKEFIRVSSQIMAKGMFDLRGWEYSLTNENEEMISSVLGMEWDRKMDTISIKKECCQELKVEKITKREILALTQRVFDPIGFTCPSTLFPKLLLQKLWMSKIKWDKEVDEDVGILFKKWVGQLIYLSEIKVSRWIHGTRTEENNWSLHAFCDASREAYAAAIFLRNESEGTVHVHLLQAKSRVAPLKKLSIPRLELLAATIAARIYSSIKEDLNDPQIESHFWSDSKTVISWIKKEDQWSTFVWNRTQEIRLLTKMEDWHHVPGELNPADLPSRGCMPKQLFESRWWEGPSWLYKPSDCWPKSEENTNEEEVNKERRKRVISALTVTQDESWYSKYFSKYEQIVRLIGWILRFTNNCRKKSTEKRDELTIQEIDEAEKFLLRLIQKEKFEGVEDKQISPLRPFIDEFGIIRLRTRISNRPDIRDFRHPIVLPARHPVITRLIQEKHVQACHAGIQGLQSILRERYWILGGRKTIRTALSKCFICRRHNTRNLEVETPPLPSDRVREAVAFEITGVDLAGPIFLRNKQKAWIVLFTCAVYRAVHFELITSLSTVSFMQALRRFIARRGRPSVVYSDNGTNFVGTANAFDRLDWNAIERHSSVHKIQWKFNPPTAAWWGGWWERLVRTLKQLLRRVLGRACLNYEEFATILCDCEAVVNARPITYLANDPSDLIALTPSMFLREQQEIGVPDCDTVDSTNLDKRLKYRQRLLEDLRSRFRSEYLGQLTQTGSNRKARHSLTIGEVVLVGNDSSKRFDWPLGRIEDLIPGKDGEVRLVRVKTANGQLLRPIQRIYPLECATDADLSEVTISRIPEDGSESGANEDILITRSGRRIRKPLRYQHVS